MLPVSDDYRNNIYGTEREFKGRVTIKMDAFATNTSPTTYDLKPNYVGKISGSVLENRNIAKFIKATTVQTPTAGWTELNQSYYDAIKTIDNNPFDVYTNTSGQFGQMLFSCDVIGLLQDTFGDYIWQGKDTLADKIAIAKSVLTQMALNWTGYGRQPKAATFTGGVRYVRDYLNGSTANLNNYWNSVKALAGSTDRAQGKTATISSGTLTNVANITDGNDTTYAYEASGNGVQKYVQIDLGAVYNDITAIQVIHYYLDGRTFHGTKTEISSDGVNWTTLYDSAVSGEYVETSTGKTYTPSASGYDYSANLNIWNASVSSYGGVVSNTASTFTKLTKTTTVMDCIDANGFVHFIAYGGVASATVAAELFTDYAEFEFNISLTNIKQYDDTTIMKINIVEEINVLNDNLPANEVTLTFDNSDGSFDFMSFANMPGILNSKPTIGVELGLVTDDIGTVEWIPSGWFIMTSWSTDVTNKIISIVGNDYFGVLSDVSYGVNTLTNPSLYDLANDVLAVGGVPTEQRSIDDSLKTIIAGNFTDRTDCRTALQDIALAARVCVYQDRLGNVSLKPFTTIDKISNFLLYTRTQLSIAGNYAGTNTYSVMNTESGMKFITYDEMYEPPEITLDTVIYQLVITVYTKQADGSWEGTEYVYTNPTFNGQNGQSFSIDNQLVITKDMADKIADWYFSESNYNAEYKSSWRGNPAIECTDLVLVQDPFESNKQTRVFRQEINYEGFLSGITESRGGV